MSQLGFVYGTYFNRNQLLDSSRTSSRFQAKWRSQIPVRFDLGLRIIQPSGGWIRLQNTIESEDNGFYVEIVHISDLDYQLRNTDPVGDAGWIEARQGAIRVERSKFIGNNAVIKSTYIPSSVVEPNADNPNDNPYENIVYTPKPVTTPPIPFTEERLELGYDYGAVGGPSFSTEILKVADGRETRNSQSYLPLHRFQLGDRTLAESERDKLEEVSYLKQFHTDRQGSYQGFRYKDWADYEADHQLIGIGDGTTQAWQLRKGYWVGDVVTWRPITKPVGQTVVLWANGEEQTPASLPGGAGWTVNHETGVISKSEPLAVGVVLTASFEFDVPVRFESDAIDFSLQGYESETDDIIYRLGSVFVKEIRIPLSLPWNIQPAGSITEELEVGIIYDTVEQYSYATERQELRSGWDTAKPNREDSKLVLNLGDRVYDRGEVDKLLAYFWNARGKLNQWNFSNMGKSYRAKFDTDLLNLRFEALGRETSLFNVSSLKLQLSQQFELLDYIDADTFVYIFIDTSGSMDSSIPAILDAVRELKSVLASRVYGSAEQADTKVIQVNFSNERWLKIPTSYYQDKAVYLIWINEAQPTYHDSANYTPPTADYEKDLSDFLASYDNRAKFRAIIYSIVFNSSAYTAFQNHLKSAIDGDAGYNTALADYQFQIRLNIPENTSAEEYYQDFSGQKLLGES